MSDKQPMVEVRRGGIVESRHRISGALCDAGGRLLRGLGESQLTVYFRSAAKPFQALQLVADGVADAFELGPTQLAICCASHSGEPAHVEAVLELLDRIGCSEDDLECGPHPPFYPGAADALRAAGREPSSLHNNCSGKHAGMLAWARHEGLETAGYRRADHPVQRRILHEVARWADEAPETLHTAIDGCGVLTFALPLASMAGAYARLVEAADRDPTGAAGRIVGAMTAEPYLVGGTGRLATAIMQTTGGRLLAKSGAEGVFCVGERDDYRGLAVKVEDGAKRGTGPAVIEFLWQAGLLGDDERNELDDYHTGAVSNTLNEVVGEVRAAFRVEALEPGDARS